MSITINLRSLLYGDDMEFCYRVLLPEIPEPNGLPAEDDDWIPSLLFQSNFMLIKSMVPKFTLKILDAKKVNFPLFFQVILFKPPYVARIGSRMINTCMWSFQEHVQWQRHAYSKLYDILLGLWNA